MSAFGAPAYVIALTLMGTTLVLFDEEEGEAAPLTGMTCLVPTRLYSSPPPWCSEVGVPRTVAVGAKETLLLWVSQIGINKQ